MRTARIPLFFALLAVFAAAPGVVAQGSTLAFVYSVRPHPGQEIAFEAALKQHMDFRQANGETFTWGVLQTVMGPDMGSYIIRSANHSWGDLDGYMGNNDFQQAAGSHFAATVAPTLAEVTSFVTALDTANSHQPPNMADMSVFMVTQVDVDTEAQIGMNEALAAYHATATEHDYYHGILRTVVGGGDRGDLAIIAYAENFAGLEERTPNINQLMMQEHGEDDFLEIAQAWLAGVENMRTNVLMSRPDLASGGN